MKFKVHMLAFGEDNEIREVNVPDEKVTGLISTIGGCLEELLGLVYHYGQNDFQPQQHCSVSMGDVIELPGGRFYRVDSFGFRRMTTDVLQEYRNIPRRDRCFSTLGESL